MRMIATTFSGLEEVLAKEIENLGGRHIEILKRAVRYFGDKELLYKSNLLLRTAIRVITPLTDFIAHNADELYDKTYEVEWERLFDVKKTIAVDAIVHSRHFQHSGFVALKVKDAIVDRFTEKTGIRPNVDNKHPQIKINVHINDIFCTISLDSSGEPLFKRGYRVEQTVAPMNEVLAAGLIQLSGWDQKTDFVDFMCGSGTIPIEAALLASNTPSQFKRTYFAFKHWRTYDKALWDSIKEKALKNRKDRIDAKIYASDISSSAIAIADDNIQSAEVDEFIILRRSPMDRLKLPQGKKHIIINPPYGVRLTGNLKALYKNIGDLLKKNYPGSTAWVFSNSHNLLKFISLHPQKKYKIYTGAIEGRFYKYEIFEPKKVV